MARARFLQNPCYLPVPTRSRELNLRPAITKGIVIAGCIPATDEMNDFELIAVHHCQRFHEVTGVQSRDCVLR